MVNSKFLHGDLHDIYVNRHKARAKQSCITTEYRGNIILITVWRKVEDKPANRFSGR